MFESIANQKTETKKEQEKAVVSAAKWKHDGSFNDLESKKQLTDEAKAFVAKQELLKMSEISLILDTYDDIFSDFDPRPYDHRAISDDLLLELKKATKENTSGVIELKFLIPEKFRKIEQEVLIKKRLREHFKNHLTRVRAEVGHTRRTGFLMVVSGIVLSLVTALYVAPLESESVLKNVILVLLEPASWFTIWEGALKIFDGWKNLQPDLNFYSKMATCEVTFTPY